MQVSSQTEIFEYFNYKYTWVCLHDQESLLCSRKIKSYINEGYLTILANSLRLQMYLIHEKSVNNNKIP